MEIAVVPAPDLSGEGVFQLDAADGQFVLERLDAETVYHVSVKAIIEAVTVTDSIQLNQVRFPYLWLVLRTSRTATICKHLS